MTIPRAYLWRSAALLSLLAVIAFVGLPFTLVSHDHDNHTELLDHCALCAFATSCVADGTGVSLFDPLDAVSGHSHDDVADATLVVCLSSWSERAPPQA